MNLAAQNATTLTIATPQQQAAELGQNLNLVLRATGGSGPYFWSVIQGKLPPKLQLDGNTGVISGMAATAGKTTVTILVQDSSVPALHAQRDFVFTIAASSTPLTIEWKQPAQVRSNEIRGSVEVANRSDQAFDLTVIILAVNEIGRATALGYQHLNLEPQSRQVIPFDGSPGGGRYVVHADAVAEVESTHSIYRARQETKSPLQVTDTP